MTSRKIGRVCLYCGEELRKRRSMYLFRYCNERHWVEYQAKKNRELYGNRTPLGVKI